MCNLYRQRATENLSRLFDARPLADQPEVRLDIYPKYDACVVRIRSRLSRERTRVPPAAMPSPM